MADDKDGVGAGASSMKPLVGHRVLDFSKVLAGPLCTQNLGELGADVIKVEPRDIGDDTRRWPPFRGETGAIFLSANRNKKSLAVDLKTEKGREIVHRLARSADIVVESYGAGVAERLGIDYATLRAENPRLIYCTISGFGRTGPLKDALGYDVILQAFSGIMAMTGEPGGNPIRSPFSPIDQTTGQHAYAGILAALLRRGQTGLGAYLEVSLFETAVAFLGYNLQVFWETGTVPRKFGSGHESLCPYQAFAAKDKPVLIGIASDNLWRRFCTSVERPELATDPRFRTNPDRVKHFGETVSLVQNIVKERDCDAWVAELTRIGVPCAPINTIAEMLAHAHTRERGIVMEYDHPVLGALKTIAQPVMFDGVARTVSMPPPMLGGDTREILAAAGYSAADIAAMIEANIVLAA